MKEILDEIRQLKYTARTIRIFILLFGCVITLVIHRIGIKNQVQLISVTGLISLTGLVFWRLFAPIYRIVSIIGICVGWAMNKSILTLFYIIVVIPFAYIFRSQFTKRLHLTFADADKTYWIRQTETTQNATDMKKQY